MNENVARIWIRADAILIVFVGLLSAGASLPVTSGPWLMLLDLLKWPLDGDPSTFDLTSRAVNAILGAVLVGWGLTMLLLVGKKLGSLFGPIRRALLIAVISWFVLDTIGSLFAELPGNVVLNVAFFAILFPPLALVRK